MFVSLNSPGYLWIGESPLLNSKWVAVMWPLGGLYPDKIFLFWLSDMLVQSEYYKSRVVHKLFSLLSPQLHVEMSKSQTSLPLIKSSVVYSSVRISPQRREEELGVEAWRFWKERYERNIQHRIWIRHKQQTHFLLECIKRFLYFSSFCYIPYKHTFLFSPRTGNL